MSERLPLDHPTDQHVWVSHEAIYGWTYALPKGGPDYQCRAVCSDHPRHRLVHGRTLRVPRIRGIRWIDERHADAVERQVPERSCVGQDSRSAAATATICPKSRMSETLKVLGNSSIRR